MGVNETSSLSFKLTMDTFQEIFKTIEPDVEINQFEEAQGSVKGDNYTATLYRIHLIGQKKSCDGKHFKWEKSLICKRLPDNIVRREAYKSVELFRNEVKFYTLIMPELLRFQKSKTSKLFHAMPQTYFARNDFLVMEDLKNRGFKMPDRQIGLTVEQTFSVLKEISNLHALSLAYKFQHPKQFENLKNQITEGIFSTMNESWYKNYYAQLTKNAVQMVSNILPSNSLYVQSLMKFAESSTFFNRMIQLVTRESTLSVICHGDCWTNNFMYKYDEKEKLIETCLVDFQCIRYGSPALDVSSLIFCCTTKCTREQYFHNFIKSYVNELYHSLLLYGPLPDFCDTEDKCFQLFQHELKTYGKFCLGIAMDILPISTCSSEDAPDLYGVRSEEASGAPELNFPLNDSCQRKMSDLVVDLVDLQIL